MKTVSGRVVSSRPVSLSTAANIMSDFAVMDNGAPPSIRAYLKLTAGSLNDLVFFHKQLKASTTGHSGGVSSSITSGGVGNQVVISPIDNGGQRGTQNGGGKVQLTMRIKGDVMDDEDAGGNVGQYSEMKRKQGGDEIVGGYEGRECGGKKHKEKKKTEDGRDGVDGVDGHHGDANPERAGLDSDTRQRKKGNKERSMNKGIEGTNADGIDAHVETGGGKERKHKKKSKSGGEEGRKGDLKDAEMTVNMNERGRGGASIQSEQNENWLKNIDSEGKKHKKMNKHDTPVKIEVGIDQEDELSFRNYGDGKQHNRRLIHERDGGESDQKVVVKRENQDRHKRKTKDIEDPTSDYPEEWQRPTKRKKIMNEAKF